MTDVEKEIEDELMPLAKLAAGAWVLSLSDEAQSHIKSKDVHNLSVIIVHLTQSAVDGCVRGAEKAIRGMSDATKT